MTQDIGYLGPEGTFTEIAAKSVFSNDTLKPYMTIPKCMEAVKDGEIDYCVVPLENSIEGSVNLTIDCLYQEESLPIIAEVVVQIRQQMIVHPNQQQDWGNVTTVYSHRHALAQCHHFLKDHLPEAELSFTNSTAAAAEWIKEHPEEKAAAVCNELAAKKYGLVIAKKDIHDYNNNHTRFVILSKKNVSIEDVEARLKTYKTTFTITLPDDHSGALHQVLSAFAWRKINLSKIESRPTKTGLGNYFFIIDVDMEMDEVLLPGVKAELEALGCKVTIVGSYPCYAAEGTLTGSRK